MSQPPLLSAPDARDPTATLSPFPGADALAALRAWYAVMSARDAVERYLADQLVGGASARRVMGTIRRALAAYADVVHRDDLAPLFACRPDERLSLAGRGQ